MAMVFSGCPGMDRFKTPTLEERVCPECGEIIEIFATDISVACDKCGFVAYNDKLSCVMWCKYARQCVGDEMYEHLMKQAEAAKKAKEEEKEARKR